MKTKKNPSNAGRKKEPDKKEPIVLMIKRSQIVGKENIHKPIKDDQGRFTEEYMKAKTDLMNMLYETCEFNANN